MRPTDRSKLNDDLAEPMDTEELESVLKALDAFTTPEPPAAATAALVERLRVYVPTAAQEHRFRATGLTTSPWELAGMLLLSQARLLRPAWWLLTALAALLWPYVAPWVGLPVAVLSPPLAAAGIAHAFREAGSPAMEMELSCRVRPAHLLLVRTLLIMAWVGLLGLLPGALGAGPGLSAFLTWSAGMLLFTGGTLVATLWAGPRGALGLMLLVWTGLTFLRFVPELRLPIWGLNDGLAAAAGLALCALSLLLAARAFRLPREEA